MIAYCHHLIYIHYSKVQSMSETQVILLLLLLLLLLMMMMMLMH